MSLESEIKLLQNNMKDLQSQLGNAHKRISDHAPIVVKFSIRKSMPQSIHKSPRKSIHLSIQ